MSKIESNETGDVRQGVSYAEELRLQALASLKRGEMSASEVERSLGHSPNEKPVIK